MNNIKAQSRLESIVDVFSRWKKEKSVAATLKKKVSNGEPVLLLYANAIYFIEAFFGYLCAGAVVAVPVYFPSTHKNSNRQKCFSKNDVELIGDL